MYGRFCLCFYLCKKSMNASDVIRDIYLYTQLLFGVYVIFFMVAIWSRKLPIWEKICWAMLVILLPLIGAFIFHAFRGQRRHAEERRRFNPNFRRGKDHQS